MKNAIEILEDKVEKMLKKKEQRENERVNREKRLEN